jgi:hypothetical protein
MMTVQQLATKLEQDGAAHPKKRARKHCTRERCVRVATRALADVSASDNDLAGFCAKDEPNESFSSPKPTDDQGFGFAWLALLLPIIQLVLQWLASRAKAHIAADKT